MTKKKTESRSQTKRLRVQRGKRLRPSKIGVPGVNVLVILDKSGSMLERRRETVKAFDHYMDALRKDKHTRYYVTTTLFDTHVQPLYSGLPLENVQSIDWTYHPMGGTALLDAVGHTLTRAEERGRNLCVIITDGHENSSWSWGRVQVRELISAKRNTGRWEFIFLGATDDAWDIGTGLGIYNNVRYEPQFIGFLGQTVASTTSDYAQTGAVNQHFLRSAHTHVQPQQSSTGKNACATVELNEGDEGKKAEKKAA